jgi:hypothetical protein
MNSDETAQPKAPLAKLGEVAEVPGGYQGLLKYAARRVRTARSYIDDVTLGPPPAFELRDTHDQATEDFDTGIEVVCSTESSVVWREVISFHWERRKSRVLNKLQRIKAFLDAGSTGEEQGAKATLTSMYAVRAYKCELRERWEHSGLDVPIARFMILDRPRPGAQLSENSELILATHRGFQREDSSGYSVRELGLIRYYTDLFEAMWNGGMPFWEGKHNWEPTRENFDRRLESLWNNAVKILEFLRGRYPHGYTSVQISLELGISTREVTEKVGSLWNAGRIEKAPGDAGAYVYSFKPEPN